MKFKLFKLSLVLGLGLLSSSTWAQVTVQAPNALGNAGAWNSSTQIIVCQQSGGCDLTGSKPLQLGTGAQLSAFVNSALPPINLAVGGGGGVTGLLPASNLATGVAASNLGFTPLNPANNLSDLASVTTAQTNLGLGSLALLSTPLPYADLPALSANQLLGALTATTPSGLSVPSCSGSTNALTWASGVGFGCNTITGGGSTAFSSITGGTNASAAMVVGTGASLAPSGTGTIAATSVPANGLTGSTLTSGLTAPSLTVTTAFTATGLVTNADLANSTIGLAVPSWLTPSGSPASLGGTITLTGTSESANLFLASPNGSSGAMTPRAILLADLPLLSANTVLGALTGTTPSGLAVPSCIDSAGNHLNYTLGTGFSCGTTSSGGSTTITLGAGLAAIPTSYNAGTQTVTNGSTVSPQLFYEGHATSYTVLSTDGAKLLTATAASVTFTAPNPGSVGTTTYQFGYDASHSYTITTVGGTASIYGCGSTSTSVSLTYPAQIITDGTNYQCVPNGGSGSSGNMTGSGTSVTGNLLQANNTGATLNSATAEADWSFSSNVLVGNFNSTAVPSPATLVSNGAIIAGADGTNSGLGLIGTNGAQGIVQAIAYGGTLASPTALGTNINIGAIEANGYDGTSVTTTAPVGIQFQTCSGAAWSHSVNTCTLIGFHTTASGSVTPGTNAALGSDGSFIVAASAGAVTSPGAHGLYVSGPTSITQGYSVPSALTDGATIAVNAALSNNFTVTIAGNRTLSNPTNLVAGQILNFQITQDATGNRTLAFGANYNGAISLNPAANAVTLFSCYASSSSSLQCAGGAPAGVTASNCSSGASPAVCGSARAGSVAVPTGATPTLVINSTAVTANSEILLNVDESATIAGTTCNTTLATLVNPVVTARSAGTSFTIQMNSTLAANPACVDYQIVN